MAMPVIRSVTATPTVVQPGQTAQVVIDARTVTSYELTTTAPGVSIRQNPTAPNRFSVTVLSGRTTVTLTARVRDAAGRTATATTKLTVPLLVGMSAQKGLRTREIVAEYPGIRYMRDFGADSADADNLPELPPLNAGKFVDAPTAVMHVSWKDDVAQLGGWLDGLSRPVYLTWYHEPMGDVAPATYRATAARVTQIVAAHPRRRYVLGHGPIVTRYWLDEGAGNPTDWGYPGMTHYGIDCYSRDTGSYWTPFRMFGVAFGKVRAAYPGTRLLVPEYGLVRTTTDSTGAGRAKAMRDHVTWLRQQPNVDAIAYWNNWAEYQISGLPLESDAWRALQAT
jgi:hypothetical protein